MVSYVMLIISLGFGCSVAAIVFVFLLATFMNEASGGAVHLRPVGVNIELAHLERSLPPFYSTVLSALPSFGLLSTRHFGLLLPTVASNFLHFYRSYRPHSS